MNQPYPVGLAAKSGLVQGAMSGYGELNMLAVAPVREASPAVGYRLRAKLVSDGDRRLGLFAFGTHDVVDIPGCPVMVEPLRIAADALRELLPLEVPLVGADLRLCDRGTLICLIVEGTAEPSPPELERLAEVVTAGVPGLAGLAISMREPGRVQLLGGAPRVLRGALAEPHHLSLGEPYHLATHGAFTQAHAGQAARLHAEVLAALDRRFHGLEGRRVLELYAGSGSLALRFAKLGAKVLAVDSFGPGLARLSQAAAAQGLRVETAQETSERWIEQEQASNSGTSAQSRFDAVLVNPPRRGLEARVREGLARLAPRAIVYISCEPRTLARDLAHLARLGYLASEVAPFDMIPLSDAVESLVVAERSPFLAPEILYEDSDSLVLNKPGLEPTTPQGEYEGSLLERARRCFALPELTPVHRLDYGTSGVCWFAKSPGRVAPLAAAIGAGQKCYHALAHGIVRAHGRIARPLTTGRGQQVAITHYRRREVIAGHSFVELEHGQEQGRKHQLRRHLAAIGHGVLGDERYGSAASTRHFFHRHGLDRTFLHCASIELELPSGPRRVSSSLSPDLEAVVRSLRGSVGRHSGWEG
jgi:23S rRNA (uracil1939-C5)-methyltransferase